MKQSGEGPPKVIEYIAQQLGSANSRRLPIEVANLLRKMPFGSSLLRNIGERVYERLLRRAAYEHLSSTAFRAMDIPTLSQPDKRKAFHTPHFGLMQIEISETRGGPLLVLSWDKSVGERKFDVSGRPVVVQEQDHHAVLLNSTNSAIETTERHFIWFDEATPDKKELRKDPDKYTSQPLDAYLAVWLNYNIQSAMS